MEMDQYSLDHFFQIALLDADIFCLFIQFECNK